MFSQFSILLILVFILELSAGISGYVLRNQTARLVGDGLKNTMKDYGINNSMEITKIWDEIQTDFQCCGVDGPVDWKVVVKNNSLPMSCCKPGIGIIGNKDCVWSDKPEENVNVYTTGCVIEFGNYVRAHAVSLGAAGIILAFIQVSHNHVFLCQF